MRRLFQAAARPAPLPPCPPAPHPTPTPPPRRDLRNTPFALAPENILVVAGADPGATVRDGGGRSATAGYESSGDSSYDYGGGYDEYRAGADDYELGPPERAGRRALQGRSLEAAGAGAHVGERCRAPRFLRGLNKLCGF